MAVRTSAASFISPADSKQQIMDRKQTEKLSLYQSRHSSSDDLLPSGAQLK